MQPNPMMLAKMLAKKNSNPMINNLIDMAEKGDTKGIENFASNFFKEQGRDFNKEYAEFMKQFKR